MACFIVGHLEYIFDEPIGVWNTQSSALFRIFVVDQVHVDDKRWVDNVITPRFVVLHYVLNSLPSPILFIVILNPPPKCIIHLNGRNSSRVSICSQGVRISAFYPTSSSFVALDCRACNQESASGTRCNLPALWYTSNLNCCRYCDARTSPRFN